MLKILKKGFYLVSMRNLNIAKKGLIFLTAILSCATASARIGEVRAALEARLMSKSDGAYHYDTKEERLREAMELPYRNLFLIMPKNTEQRFYFKRATSGLSLDSDTIQQHDLFGWELHICFANNKSAMEFYRRHGDPMTAEELEALMQSIASSKNAKWKRCPYITPTRRWDVELKSGKLTIADTENDTKKPLSEILPENPWRFIYLEVPADIISSSHYKQSIAFSMLEDYQRIAYEKYRDLIAKQSAIAAAKTAKPNSRKKANVSIPPKVNKFNAYNMREFESFIQTQDVKLENGKMAVVKYQMKDVLVGGAKVNRSKDVQITMGIPIQPETILGYDYELSDGSVRAKLYKNAVLFIDTNFDKQMRAYIENVYKQQSDIRKNEAKASISRF